MKYTANLKSENIFVECQFLKIGHGAMFAEETCILVSVTHTKIYAIVNLFISEQQVKK